MTRKTMSQTTVDALVAERLNLSLPLERKKVEQKQMELLQATIEHARSNSSLYKKRFSGLTLSLLVTARDVEKIPFLTSADIVERGHQLHCVSQSEVVRIITMHTSGSTGKPKRFSFTASDLEATSDFFLRGMASLVDPSDHVLVLLPFETEASVGELLIAALAVGGISAQGLWPPTSTKSIAELISYENITSVVGLPQQLLALSEELPRGDGDGQLKTMLLCSDYAPAVLRKRIEKNCGCETFLHYGATESGLGGGVECSCHCGTHIRESELLVEIIDPVTGTQLPDGEEGEVVLTTLGREAMPLIRYRTGDIASLDTSQCLCGGITARLCNIYGRRNSCFLSDGCVLCSQELDDVLFQIPGLLDYRVTLDNSGVDSLNFEYISSRGDTVGQEMRQLLSDISDIAQLIGSKKLLLEKIQQVESFAQAHTLKRTILDIRYVKEMCNAVHS
jgi:phenylacetate-coenzyme A ligase PaaK-like adenylate-forming protein